MGWSSECTTVNAITRVLSRIRCETVVAHFSILFGYCCVYFELVCSLVARCVL